MIDSFVFAFVTEQLSGRVQDIVAVITNTVDVIANERETTVWEVTLVCFEKLFETIFEQLFVFNVERFVFFYQDKKQTSQYKVSLFK